MRADSRRQTMLGRHIDPCREAGDRGRTGAGRCRSCLDESASRSALGCAGVAAWRFVATGRSRSPRASCPRRSSRSWRDQACLRRSGGCRLQVADSNRLAREQDAGKPRGVERRPRRSGAGRCERPRRRRRESVRSGPRCARRQGACPACRPSGFRSRRGTGGGWRGRGPGWSNPGSSPDASEFPLQNPCACCVPGEGNGADMPVEQERIAATAQTGDRQPGIVHCAGWRQ